MDDAEEKRLAEEVIFFVRKDAVRVIWQTDKWGNGCWWTLGPRGYPGFAVVGLHKTSTDQEVTDKFHYLVKSLDLSMWKKYRKVIVQR